MTGRQVHPDLHQEGHQVVDVAVAHIERCQPQPKAQRRRQRQQQKKGSQMTLAVGGCGRRASARPAPEAHAEVHQAAQYAADRDHQAREVDLGDQVGAPHQALGGAGQRAGKVVPGQQPGIGKDGIGCAVGGRVQQIAKEQGKDDHAHQRLQDDPRHAQRRLFVAHLDIAPHQKAEQFAIFPQRLAACSAASPRVGWMTMVGAACASVVISTQPAQAVHFGEVFDADGDVGHRTVTLATDYTDSSASSNGNANQRTQFKIAKYSSREIPAVFRLLRMIETGISS
jgi:hypothetical protein